MFTLGMLDLPDKAKIESLYWEISLDRGEELSRTGICAGGKSAKLEDSLGDQYMCNFFGVPIAAGPLGAGAVVSDHANQQA